MQHSHGLGFGCLASRCSLDLGYMPLPWLLPHCGFVTMHFGHAMALAAFSWGLLWPCLLVQCWVIFPIMGFFFFFPSNEVIWVGQHTLALATCP